MEIFNGQMTSRTSTQTKDIRRGEEGVCASDLGPSENQATGGVSQATTCTISRKTKSERKRICFPCANVYACVHEPVVTSTTVASACVCAVVFVAGENKAFLK